MDDIRFQRREKVDTTTGRKVDEVVVIRSGCEVAALPDSSRLDRAMSLPLEEVVWIARNFRDIMKRDPAPAEREFWRAIVDYKRSQADLDSGAAQLGAWFGPVFELRRHTEDKHPSISRFQLRCG